MRGSGKGAAAKDQDPHDDPFLHQTIGAARIRNQTAKHGSHRLHRHHHFATNAPPTAAAGAAGASASSVSSYLENLPSLTLNDTTNTTASPPPRPPRPPGGLLGISNGRGMGYGRSLGSSYDSPMTIHDSFNGHVRSGANLYGGRNQSSGIMPTRPATGPHRPSMSVFPIQKALEIAMKESRLLAAASSKGGAGANGTGMSTGITFVRELRRARHARGAIITEHGPTPDISLDEEDEDGEEEDAVDDVMDEAMDANADDAPASSTRTITTPAHFSTNMDGSDISARARSSTVTSFDLRGKTHYPGIAQMPHTLSTHTGAVAVSLSRSLRNVIPLGSWQHQTLGLSSSSSALSAAASSSTPSQYTPSSSPSTSSSSSSAYSMSTASATPYQPQVSSFLRSTPLFSRTRVLSSHALPSVSGASSSSSTPTAVHAVRELLDSYPAPSPYCVDDKKRSPLHFAAASGDLELVEFLLERGVRPDCGRDIAGNMPLHLAIISNRVDVVAALLKAGADMTLASPMTHKTPLDLAESRLSYLLSRAQETAAEHTSGSLDPYNSQLVSRSSFPPPQSPALLYQIKGIVNLLRPYVVRQQKLQHGERQKDRQKERSWNRADKYMRQQDGSSLWRVDPHSDDNYGDKEDEDEDDDEEDDDQMDTGEGHQRSRTLRIRDHSGADMDDDDERPPAYMARPPKLGRSVSASTFSQQSAGGDIGDGNLADSELDTGSEQQDVEDGLPDLLEQVQQVLQAIKLNEHPSPSSGQGS
ncbi:hypothetical protein BGZ70_001640 [Mortierella alpina]|uniref:Uncharacterized protein n=1 Tax=Mortierella alpina TaxID=64518 RepID=A0A9P6LXK0_MORAP|nr:hypothetical protein BGZ70_001640 [Mortierella alpina]